MLGTSIETHPCYTYFLSQRVCKVFCGNNNEHQTDRRLINVSPQEVTVQLPWKGNRLAEQPIRRGHPPSLTPNVRGNASRYRRARGTGRTRSCAAPGSRIGTETSRRGGASVGGVERGVRQTCVGSSAFTGTGRKGGGGGGETSVAFLLFLHCMRFYLVLRTPCLVCVSSSRYGDHRGLSYLFLAVPTVN